MSEQRVPTQEELEKAKDAVVGEQPTIPDPADSVVELPRGILSADGVTWERKAVIRELTGADEEGIARMTAGNNATNMLVAMLAYGVESIGPHALPRMPIQERAMLLDGLLVGERELLFLNVIKTTFGDRRTLRVRCKNGDCAGENDVSFSITDDIPIKQMDDPDRFVYEFTCKDGTRIEYRLVTGADQAEVNKRVGTTTAEMNTMIIARVLTSVNGKQVVDPKHFALNMKMMDRRDLVDALTAQQPGPYFPEVKLPCATCGAESLFVFNWADLL